MATYKTPGVYVEEISLLPPSVAEVASAVPAFIGYTEKAEHGGVDLKLKPTLVTSFKDFESMFGYAPPLNLEKVELEDGQYQVKKITAGTRYHLYHSLYLYFMNGGGPCYIVSVGGYKDTPKKTDFEAGIAKLNEEDDVTLLVLPDLMLLADAKGDPTADIAAIQAQALSHCNTMQNRFAILDVFENPEDDQMKWRERYQNFRDAIGTNYLHYGAAYTPYLYGNLGIQVGYRDLFFKEGASGTRASIVYVGTEAKKLTDLDPSSATAVKALEEAIQPTAAVVTEIENVTAKLSGKDITRSRSPLMSLHAEAHKAFADNTRMHSSLTTLMAGVHALGTGASATLAGMTKLRLHQMQTSFKRYFGPTFSAEDFLKAETVPNDFADNLDPKHIPEAGNAVLGLMAAVVDDVERNIERLDNGLATQCPLYANIQAAVAKDLSMLPPSGVIAGIYAMVDRDRGVWKAPANVSLASIAGPVRGIDSATQEDLNVDVTAGKSINAIRFFPGKGLLVWGARTLDGNSNEWRYVPVRRLFINVEESLKRSTAWAVFEPNDANLWIKIKAMTENYLTDKWKSGALAGAAPADAFYVGVGLGSTMSSQDILEGRLIVEIGMAAVRPAEFIVLRFMHKIQQS